MLTLSISALMNLLITFLILRRFKSIFKGGSRTGAAPPPFPLKFWGKIFVNYDACKKAKKKKKKKKKKLRVINRE